MIGGPLVLTDDREWVLSNLRTRYARADRRVDDCAARGDARGHRAACDQLKQIIRSATHQGFGIADILPVEIHHTNEE